MTAARLPRDVAEAVAKLEPQVRKAFLAAIADMRDFSNHAELAKMIDAGDIDGAIAALRFDASLLAGLDAAVLATYVQGGVGVATALRRKRNGGAAVGFDLRALTAQEWARRNSARMVTDIVDDQKAMVREVIARGIEGKRRPRAVALDIVGRVNAKTGRREGGAIGLTSGQAKWADDARVQLEGGDWNGYMRRELRNRSFDKLVAIAERDKRELTDGEIDRVIGAYRRNILRYRGETIARTETLTAIRAARHEAYVQAVESGQLRNDQIVRTWVATGDARTRDSHVFMHGETLRGVYSVWNVRGNFMHYPADVSLGAAADQTINCRCFEQFKVLK